MLELFCALERTSSLCLNSEHVWRELQQTVQVEKFRPVKPSGGGEVCLIRMPTKDLLLAHLKPFGLRLSQLVPELEERIGIQRARLDQFLIGPQKPGEPDTKVRIRVG